MKYIIIALCGLLFSLTAIANPLPAFLEKTKTGYKEKPVILVTEKKDQKYIVMAAYFPDNKCVKYPDSTIMALPHKIVLTDQANWMPCSPVR